MSEYDYDEMILAADLRRNMQGKPGEHGGTIPLYGMLDVWMALYGTSHPEFDEFYAEHGYAETWARILAAVRDRRTVQGDPTDAQLAEIEQRVYDEHRPRIAGMAKELVRAGWEAALHVAATQEGENRG